jgi:hypothetical protein
MPPAGPLAAGVLAGHQPAEPYERGRPSEPSPVADLGGQRERAKLGHPKVGLDRDQLRVAALQRRTIVRVGCLQRRFIELLAAPPPLVGLGPRGRPTTPEAAVAQQELRQPMPRPRAIFHPVGAGPAQIPDGFLLDGRDANGDQLAGAVQPGPAGGSRACRSRAWIPTEIVSR